MNKKIYVGIDDSSRAPAVLGWALENADSTDQIVALTVWNLGLVGGFENPFSNLNEAQISATNRVNKLIERVTLDRWGDNHPSLPVKADVRHGDTATELVNATEDADLLVLGNCHYNRPGKLGAVAEAVIYGAQCAVVLVPVTQVDALSAGTETGTLANS